MTLRKPTYGRLELQGNRWVLSDVPPHVAIKLKSIFSGIPKTQTKTFELPATDIISADVAWFESRYRFDMDHSVRMELDARKSAFEADMADREAIFLPDWKPEGMLHGFKPGYAPYHGQRQAIELYYQRKSLLVADEGGGGKTWVAMGAMAGSPCLPAAVVVDANLAIQWQDEFIKPYTYLSSHIIEGTTPYTLPAANCYIFKYSNLAGWSDIAATGFFKQVIFDEIQAGRTGLSSQKGQAMKVFADNAQMRMGLSATFFFNYGSEAWNIMNYIDPDLLGPFDDFVREWCRMGPGGKWVVEDPDALGSYLRESQAIVRRKGQGRKVNKLIVNVDYDEDKAAEAESLARVLANKVVTGSFAESGQAARELDALARHTTGVAKAKAVAAYVRILLEQKVPVILAGWHHDVYRIWLDELAEFNPVMFTGRETPRQKSKNKKAFIAGESDLFIISLRAAQGIDGLQKRCRTVVIGELDWAPPIYDQIVWRVDRPGQESDEIDVLFCVSDGGSDPTVMAVNAIKRDQSRGIHDPGQDQPPVHADVAHIKMLAQSYLERKAA